MIGADPRRVLPPSHVEALYAALDVLTDEFVADVARLAIPGRPADFGSTTMALFLPRQHLHRYNLAFAKHLVICLIVVGWKLRAPGTYRLACLGEQLALHAVLRQAEVLLEDRGEGRPDYRAYEQLAFDDQDYQFLFDPRLDGIEADSKIASQLGISGLRFADWFTSPEGEPVHPYIERPGWWKRELGARTA